MYGDRQNSDSYRCRGYRISDSGYRMASIHPLLQDDLEMHDIIPRFDNNKVNAPA